VAEGLRAWGRQNGGAMRDATRRLARSPVATLLNVVVIGVALSLPVGLYLGLTELQGMARQLSSDPQLSLFLDRDAASDQARDIERRLRQHPLVASVQFIPKERALDDLKRGAGLAEVLDSLKENPLPDAFVATVKGNAPDALEALHEEALGWPKVAHAQLDSEWARKLDAVLRIGRTLALLLAVLLGAGLVAVTFNTIRLQILTRRDEIEVAKLIGATDAFVRRPFLYFGGLQGLAGGLMAWAVVAGALWFLNRELAGLSALYASGFRLRPLSGEDALVLFSVAAALGWLGAWLSVSRYLWQVEPR
jgi:cell division transport system permease protein